MMWWKLINFKSQLFNDTLTHKTTSKGKKNIIEDAGNVMKIYIFKWFEYIFTKPPICPSPLMYSVTQGLFCQHGLILITAWISNHMASKVWYEITYPFPKFNSCTFEVQECSFWNFMISWLLLLSLLHLNIHKKQYDWKKSLLNYSPSLLIIQWSSGFLHTEIPVEKIFLLSAGLFVEKSLCKSILGPVLLENF